MKVEVSTSGETWHEVPFTTEEDLANVKLSDVFAAIGQRGTFQIRTRGPIREPFYVTPDPTWVDADMKWRMT